MIQFNCCCTWYAPGREEISALSPDHIALSHDILAYQFWLHRNTNEQSFTS